MTGDTDLTHAVFVFKQTFPRKKIGFIFPMERKHYDLINLSDFNSKIKEPHLIQNRFPDKVKLKDCKLLDQLNGCNYIFFYIFCYKTTGYVLCRRLFAY
jgi:hypothetical protein